MTTSKARKNLLIGILGCIIFVIGDFLYAATGRKQSTQTLGLMVKAAYLDMATWRMIASIICGVVGTILYYIGFHQMYKLLKCSISNPRERKWLTVFRTAYLTGTVCWAYVHSMFMNTALTFKFVFEKYGDMQTAAEITNKIFYCNVIPMSAAFVIGDILLSATVIVMVWKRIIPLNTTAERILATLCNPIASAGIIGNFMTLFPWPVNQLDVGSESLGHALVLVLGLVLLNGKQKSKCRKS